MLRIAVVVRRDALLPVRWPNTTGDCLLAGGASLRLTTPSRLFGVLPTMALTTEAVYEAIPQTVGGNVDTNPIDGPGSAGMDLLLHALVSSAS
jgi:hypothetical protein